MINKLTTIAVRTKDRNIMERIKRDIHKTNLAEVIEFLIKSYKNKNE